MKLTAPKAGRRLVALTHLQLQVKHPMFPLDHHHESEQKRGSAHPSCATAGGWSKETIVVAAMERAQGCKARAAILSTQ